MSPLVSLLVGVVVVLLITAATGWFVAQEFAYMAVDRSRLASRAAAGDTAAERTLEITKRTSFLLSGAQLGITVTGLLVGYVAEPLIGQAVAAMTGGSISTALAVTLGGVVALAFSTLVQMLFGELVPKNYAIAEADRVAGWLSASTRIYLTLFGPLIWVFDKTAEGFLRLLRIEPVHDVEHAATVRDLEHVVAESRASGDLSPELSTLLDRILDFPERDVEHAMIPRSRVDALRDTLTVAEVRHEMATGHTRYPVLSTDDEVLGIVSLIDVLHEPVDSTRPVTEILEPPLILTQFMSLPDALDRMRAENRELACVIDEYGGFTGILTVEDLAEEVVGELTDEHDPAEPEYEPVAGDGVWVMAGDVHVDEVERSLDVELPEGDYETVAGLALDAHGGLPQEGEVIPVELPVDPADLVLDEDPDPRSLFIEVLDVENYVPCRVRLTLDDPPSGEEPAPAGGATRADIAVDAERVRTDRSDMNSSDMNSSDTGSSDVNSSDTEGGR